ncbi:MAG: hypothetical protein ACP5KE_06970 [Candidatus Methanodesulfokora sp.]|jgi:hypothetical protein
MGSDRMKERLDFIRYYAEWVKSAPNEVWSKQQADLINSFMASARNFMLSPEEYLKMTSYREERIRSMEEDLRRRLRKYDAHELEGRGLSNGKA